MSTGSAAGSVTASAPRARRGAFVRMYRGETRFDFVGRRRWWFVLSGIVIGLGLISLGYRGLNLGIDFRGGTSWTVPAPGVTQSQATSAVTGAGLAQPTVELLGHGGSQQLEIQADLNNLSGPQQQSITASVTRSLASLAHRPTTQVSVTHVGPTWGGEVTRRAVTALIVFFVAVVLYISVRFEPKMALAAFIAMVHDLAVALGVYSLAGFQVTPDTVIALLTILGYSLYDTVVVFDRVRENTKGVGSTGRMTYSDMINLSMNQTLARSINTSAVAILPVLAVLTIGAQLLGATTLQDYGLALFVGLLSGAYSSIFIASPVLAMLREREPRYVAIRQRIALRGEHVEALTPSAAAQVGAGKDAGAPTAAAARSAAGTSAAPGLTKAVGGTHGDRRGSRRPAATEAGLLRPGAAKARATAPSNGAGPRQGAPAPIETSATVPAPGDAPVPPPGELRARAPGNARSRAARTRKGSRSRKRRR